MLKMRIKESNTKRFSLIEREEVMKKREKSRYITFITLAFLISILFTGCGSDEHSEEINSKKETELSNEAVISTHEPVNTELTSESPTLIPNSTKESIATTQTPEQLTSAPGATKEAILDNNESKLEATKDSNVTTSSEPTVTTSPVIKITPTPSPTKKAEHVHCWSKATCTSPKTCKCGKTSGSKIGHSFGNNGKKCSRCGTKNPNYKEQHNHRFDVKVIQATCKEDGKYIYTCKCGYSFTEKIPSTGMHEYERGEVNCKKCGKPHEHDWEVKVVTSKEYEFIPDEDFMCHGGWHFDTYEELRAHMDIKNVHGMVHLNDGSNGCTSVPQDYDGPVDFYMSCSGWSNCAGDGEGECIEYEYKVEIQKCKICRATGEKKEIGDKVIISHTYDD